MSMRPPAIQDIPEETARIAKAAFRKGNPYMKMRDELGTCFTDDPFFDRYLPMGNPLFQRGV